MARYVLSTLAQQDLQDIRTYHLERSGAKVARYVARELTAAFRFLAATSGAGHFREDLTDEAVRFWPVFAYLVIYDSTARPIGIARVLHGSRDITAILGPRRTSP